MNFWYMQLHPGKDPNGYPPERMLALGVPDPTTYGFVIRGKDSEFEASFAFETPNGFLAEGIAKKIVRSILKDARARERELESDRITSRQLAFIKKLGGKADKGMSKADASALIESLLAKKPR